MITKKLTCYAVKDGHAVFCMVGASGTITRDNIPPIEAMHLLDEMHEDIDKLQAANAELREALHLSSIEHARALLAKSEAK